MPTPRLEMEQALEAYKRKLNSAKNGSDVAYYNKKIDKLEANLGRDDLGSEFSGVTGTTIQRAPSSYPRQSSRPTDSYQNSGPRPSKSASYSSRSHYDGRSTLQPLTEEALSTHEDSYNKDKFDDLKSAAASSVSQQTVRSASNFRDNLPVALTSSRPVPSRASSAVSHVSTGSAANFGNMARAGSQTGIVPRGYYNSGKSEMGNGSVVSRQSGMTAGGGNMNLDMFQNLSLQHGAGGDTGMRVDTRPRDVIQVISGERPTFDMSIGPSGRSQHEVRGHFVADADIITIEPTRPREALEYNQRRLLDDGRSSYNGGGSQFGGSQQPSKTSEWVRNTTAGPPPSVVSVRTESTHRPAIQKAPTTVSRHSSTTSFRYIFDSE
ncbi:hypothetical protein B7494_g2420 [Chlorociboria aeruginascens]|nr:hypothetical protein B7494_g2420 [Chlorociboria aeruginascens]